MLNKLTTRAIPVALALCVTSSALSQDREERISRTFEIGVDGELSLANVSGDIVVDVHDGTEIQVEAVKRLEGNADRGVLDAVVVEMTENGDRLRVSTRYPNHDRDGNDRRHDHEDLGSVSVDYTVLVPAGTEVDASSVSGSVRVTGVRGETSVKSVSGNVEANDVMGLQEAKSVSGNVRVSGVQSHDDLEAKSVSGDVFVRNVQTEDLEVGSVSGNLDLEDVTCEQGEFDSVSGEIEYSGSLVAGGSYEFKSHSGDITLSVGDDVGFELEAKTYSGDIESDFEMRVSERARNGRKLNAVIGNGSAVVETTTFSGDVNIRRR